jgi:hypothetical protein
MPRGRSKQVAYDLPLLRARMRIAEHRAEHGITRPGRIVSPGLQQAIDRARAANGLPALYGVIEP